MLTKSWIQKYVTFTVMQKVPWPVLVNRIKGNSISILEDPFGTWNKKKKKQNPPQTYLVLWHFALFCFIDTMFLTNWKFVAALPGTSPPLANSICSAHVVSLGHSLVIPRTFETLPKMIMNDG